MNDVTYGELELLICLHFPIFINKQGGCDTLMWLAALSSGLAVL